VGVRHCRGQIASTVFFSFMSQLKPTKQDVTTGV
jgi:hypothetical protein